MLDNQQIVTKIEIKKTKHSPNIIDLLEIYDYANGNPIIVIDYKSKWISILCINESGEKSIKVLDEREIETILTKEQYEANCYKVGVKDE